MASQGMLKSLCCDTPTRRIRLGWLSFQPTDGAISFGLSDNAYVAPAFQAFIGIWNAYNRVRTRFEIVSDPSAAERVVNPHLTWHPPNYFHFKRRDQSRDDAPFRGIAQIPMMLQQQSVVKWIRATSGPLADLKTAGPLNGRFNSQELVIRVPTESLSVQMTVDFTNAAAQFAHASLWNIQWRDVSVRLRMSFTHPQFPTIAWAHYY
jgi:hypothetical protein